MLTLRTSILLCGVLSMAAPLAADKGSLRAGAARIEITPAADAALPMAGYGSRVTGHKGIHDKLHVRAIVLADGAGEAAVVGFDLIFVPEDFWNRMTERLARETGIPRERLILASTHTHGGPSMGNVKPEFEERWKAWMSQLEDRTVEAVRQAKAALQPARLGSGTGKAYVNTNRRARMANGGWGLGINPEGFSDRTVTVVRFESLSGDPIAFLVHYAVHGTVTGSQNYQISADLPGATERFVEEHFGDKVVATFLAGASGDQNAIYEPGTNFGRLTALGRILGEEAVRVASSIRAAPEARIYGEQKVITCPGRRMTKDSNTSENKIQFEDADPVKIRLSLLMIDKLALAGVSGEVLSMISEHLKKESPFARTLLVAHTNGASGYIPDDAAYAQVSYEIWVTRLKPGCAENAIVDGFLRMMDHY